ncbi:GntR family transcriptional regulator [Blastococcus sp. CT_GayMR20]|uniref:GntR family transcriptional regulator n=1 Tax=Blastococcus sp. CT_GayMR20 TaxID=2559609 RepID=UPI0010735E49|nr:GntR family transcriptional regulator [Blastococcus sp. CT_GayMR20]TFV81110.1 GntR family transcriptional regulator [Blastococcus sp. CT_GayMR20]
MTSNVAPLGNRTVRAHVMDALRSDILSGRLPPGARLVQAQLAKQFGTSLAPVREALYELSAQGLVVLTQHHTAVVFKPTVEELIHCYEVRILLEEDAARRAADCATPADLEAAALLLDAMEASVDPNDWVGLNTQFHLALCSVARNPVLTDTIERLRALTEPYVRIYVTESSAERRADREHREILAAVVAGDRELAATTVRSHLEATKESVARRLSQTQEQWNPK